MKMQREKTAEKKRRQYAKDDHFGVVSANEAYSIRELITRFGFGHKWLNKARRDGLKTFPMGRQKGVRGAELLRYLETQEA